MFNYFASPSTRSSLGCKGFSDEAMCILFPSTLNDASLNWFYRLNPRIIDSLDHLKQTFFNHFMNQTDRVTAHFSHEYYCYLETDDRAAFDAFKSGLCESNFRYLVHSNP
ncbi:unnamed protein product [Prunus armeniaca]